jgi:hypothetical protein
VDVLAIGPFLVRRPGSAGAGGLAAGAGGLAAGAGS